MSASETDARLRRQYDLERSLAGQLRRATKAERKSLYGRVYHRLYAEVPELIRAAGTRDREREVALQAELLAPFLGPDSVFLEIGAGDGALVTRLAPDVALAYAVDAADVPGPRGPEPPNLRRVLSGDPELTFDDDAVDLAFSCHFIEHLHPDDAFDHATEVRRVLRPGGVYVCVTPNRLWGPHDVSRHFADHPGGLHLREYSHRDLKALLQRAGFSKVVALRGGGRPPRRASLTPYLALEAVLDAFPARTRRRLMERTLGARSKPPLRPLEQVVLAGSA